MKREEFKEAIQRLKDFEQERDKLDAVVNAISPSSTTVVEVGGYFIDSFIKVLEIALNCPVGWVSAFVFECEYGLYPFTGELHGKDFSVQTEDEFYDLVQKCSIQYQVFDCPKELLNNMMGGSQQDTCVHLVGNTIGIQIGTDTDKNTIK